MHALPFVIALVSAAVLAPPLVRALTIAGSVRLNFRGLELPTPLGTLTLVAALVALVPLALLQRLGSVDVFHPELLPVAVYALGVIALGLLDDALGAAEPQEASEESGGRDVPSRPRGRGTAFPRGWRGHGAAVLHGELSTGALKAVGSLGLALLASSYLEISTSRWALDVGVLVLATNAFNLLDLRPGRATKAFVLLGAGLTIGAGEARTLWSLGLFMAPALVAGAYDLRERAMLGDAGASLLGALAGFWLVLTLSTAGKLIALALLAIMTVYGELRSISAFIERTPGLRQLDSLGRPA
jgi:UDP-GlcNAc:undecaprenyl-phosphate GlcNAc-1-phosphate transferase